MLVRDGEKAMAMSVGGRRSVSDRWGRYGMAVVAVSLVTVFLAAVPGSSDSSSTPAGEGRGVFAAVTAGDLHSCAVLDDGDVRCWGENTDGRLGLGDTQDRGYGAGEMSLLPAVALGEGRSATAVTAGKKTHLCAARRRRRQVLGCKFPRPTRSRRCRDPW